MREEFVLFLSGVEPRENFQVVSEVTRNVLLSYVYIRRRGLEEIEERLSHHKGMKVLIDSGAFTFFNDPQYREKPLEWWEKYLENYTSFIKKHRENIFACVELDIDEIVGEEQAQVWREKYFYPLEEDGINVIYVFHTNKSLKDLEELCKKHSYIGFSYKELQNVLEANEVNEYVKNIFDIAMRYKTRVHGFAITGNKMLLNFPFFTVDSTSYLTGAQFCEIYFFEAGRIKHLRKESWKTEYIGQLEALGLNRRLLDIDSPYELIKASAIAYKKFEEHIRFIMFNRRYWEERVEDIKYVLPSLEWFQGDMEDWKVFGEKAGLPTNIPENMVKTLLTDMYIILNNTEQISSYSLEDLLDLCGLFGASGRDYNTKDKCIKFLKVAFKEHLDGKRKDLQNLGEKDSENDIRALEREDYIKEQEFIEVEVSKEECGELLPALLTAGYDKDEVEKDLIKQGIKPIYDKDGSIQKGIKKLRKQKKISSIKMPRLSCDRCVMASKCPEYQAGYICAYDKTFRKFNTRDAEDVRDGMSAIADVALERAQKAFMLETSMGGMPTDATSKALKEAWNYLDKLNELHNQMSGSPLVVQQTKVKGGSIEQTTITGSNPERGGILEKILLGDNTIDVEAEPIDK